MASKIAASHIHSPQDACQGAQFLAHDRLSDRARQARSVKGTAEPMNARKIRGRIVNARENRTKVRQHVAARSERDEIQPRRALVPAAPSFKRKQPALA